MGDGLTHSDSLYLDKMDPGSINMVVILYSQPKGWNTKLPDVDNRKVMDLGDIQGKCQLIILHIHLHVHENNVFSNTYGAIF